MARQKSDEKRNAILQAAIRVIDRQGLGAATAKIAAEAGVSNGSLFTYFPTKADLLNGLYLEIKSDMAGELMQGLPNDGPFQDRLRHAWGNWMDWASADPARRHAMAQLMVSDEISAATRANADSIAAPLGAFLDEIRTGGPLRDMPIGLAVRLVDGVVTATMDAVLAEPAKAPALRAAGFDAFWRLVRG
jgi:AcrR family transcriptional regulator